MIQIEPDIIGIVRHITPRLIIVRSRNSVTLVIPNTLVITRMVRNWSYMRTFSAINDIEVTLPFTMILNVHGRLCLRHSMSHHTVLKNPTPIVWLTDFND